MKKYVIVFVLMVLAISVFALYAVHTNEVKNREIEMTNNIGMYYAEEDPDNTGELKILLIKELDDNKYMVLAEKYCGEGQKFTEIFLLNSDNTVLATSNVEVPLSPCFSLGRIFYEGKTILFGTFDDDKYIFQEDKVVSVEISEVYAKLASGKFVKENVDMEKGFIIILEGESDVEVFDLFDDKGELQATIDDIIVTETKLLLKNES